MPDYWPKMGAGAPYTSRRKGESKLSVGPQAELGVVWRVCEGFAGVAARVFSGVYLTSAVQPSDALDMYTI